MIRRLDVRRIAKGLRATTELWTSFWEELDNLFDRFSGGFEAHAFKSLFDLEGFWHKSVHGFAPLAVEVNERNKAYLISAKLPVVNKKNIEGSVQDGVLLIKGRKLQEKEEKNEHRHMPERRYGRFRRMFGLPKGTEESKLDARFLNGVLTISVPEPAVTQVRKVDVEAA
jgi:HSP20 family protein